MLTSTTQQDLGKALLGAVGMALVSTFAEWTWEYLRLPHKMSYGLMHGALVFVVLGFFLGLNSPGHKRVLAGALGGLLAGIAAAGSFYLLAPLLRFLALFVAWFCVWIFFAILRRWLAGDSETLSLILFRGVLAGLSSGPGFYAISALWSGHPSDGNNYWLFFGSWVLAFFPGIASLTVGSSTRMSPIR